MNIGQRIRHQRKIKKMTQEQLGKEIGVSKMAISKYERNIVDNMGRDKVLALSNILDIPVVEFLESSDDTCNIEKITPKQFVCEVKILLLKTEGITEQQKDLLITTLNIICSDN